MRKFIVFFILYLGISFPVKGQLHTGSWNPVLISEDTCTGVQIFFSDTLTGYVNATSYYKPLLDNPIITSKWYKTTDGGFTWTAMKFNGLSKFLESNLHGLQYATPTANSIFLAKNISYPSSNYPIIAYSLDRGSTWDSVNTSLDLSQYFTMFSEKIGLGFGKTKTKNILLQTFQGATGFSHTTGDSMFAATMAADYIPSNYFSGTASFSDQANGCVVVYDANINNSKGLTTILTTDGGNRWSKYHTDFSDFPNDTIYGDIQFQKGTPNVWLSPYSQASESVTFPYYYSWHRDFNLSYVYSSDYGKSWIADSSFPRRRGALWGAGPGNVWMLLYANDYDHLTDFPPKVKIIVHTTNFGVNWDVDTISLNHVSDFGNFDAKGFYFVNKNNGWIAAINNKRPYVLRYVPKPINEVHIEHAGLVTQNIPIYPNPASDKVTIVAPDYLTLSHIELYDILGRRKEVPYSIENSTIQINTHGISNGIWMVMIGHQYGTTAVRFIEQK